MMYALLASRLTLLVAGTISNHLTHTSPNAAPSAEEQAKFKAATPVWERGFTMVHAASVVKVSLLMRSLPSFNTAGRH